MALRWRATPQGAAEPASVGLDQSFPTRADAEGWLTLSYEELVEAGFTEVTLWDEDHCLYGPMSLLA